MMPVAEKRFVQCLPTSKCEIPDQLKVVEDVKGVAPAGHGMFRILSKDGDTRVVWNRYSIAEVREAKSMFDDLIAKGMVPYQVDANGQSTPVVMQEFDPSAEEVIFMPIQMIVGG